MSFRARCWKPCLLSFAVLAWCAASVTASFGSSPGGGVDDDAIFELDGSAVNDAPPGDDWGNALAYPGHPAGGSALAQTWDPDLTNTTSDNQFTGGGSKDTQGIQSGAWLWNTSKPQAKDDIAHAFAAAYSLPNGHTAIHFGMDRYDNSGAATAGFWFFQDSTVGLSSKKSQGGFKFTGKHMNGDLLIVADFTIGGGTSAIQVYTWSGDDATGTLVLNSNITEKDCNPTTGTSPLCAIVNAGDAVSPWGFLNKSGQTLFAHGELLEGGIDLNAVFGANIPCFTTFMAETRSSNSPTATLSDFSPPASFPLCGISIAKNCNGGGQVSNGGNTVSYSWTVTVTNTGIGNLYDVTVLDTLPDGSKQNIALVDESTNPNFLAGKSSVSGTVNFTVTCSAGVCTGSGGGPVANPLSVTNTADVQAFTEPNSGGTKIVPEPDVPQTSTCTTQAPGEITVTKHCDATGGGPLLVSNGGFVVVKVPFTADVKNTTTPGAGEAVNNITLSDVPAATFTQNGTISSLAPGQTVTAKGYYFPSAVDAGSNGLIAGRYFFTDTLTATGTGAIGGEVVTNQGAVSCPICPEGECDGPLP